MTMMRVDGRFDDRPHALLALAERLLDGDAPAQIVEDAGKRGLPVELHLPDRQMKGKRAAVFSAAAHFAAGADDARDPGLQIVGEVTVVLLEVGAGHQHLDVLVEHLRCASTRIIARRPG